MNAVKFIISDKQYIKVHFEQLKKLDSNICITCYQVDVDYIDERGNLFIRFGYATVQDICYFIRHSSQIQSLLKKSILPG